MALERIAATDGALAAVPEATGDDAADERTEPEGPAPVVRSVADEVPASVPEVLASVPEVPPAVTARYFHAVAIDYDGTLAQHDRADPDALRALAGFRADGGRVILVTGRILSELRAVFPDVDEHVDLVVAENGGVIAFPGGERALAPPVPDVLCDALSARGVRFGRGHVLLACSADDEQAILAEVRRLELEYQLVRNRGALMVLPAGVSKGAGLFEALGDLGISHHNTIAFGDAENDHSLLEVAELGVAVGDAVASLKAQADVTLNAPNGAGVAAFVRGPVVDGRQRVRRRRWRLDLGVAADGTPVSVSASQTNILVTGTTHGGKSRLSGLIAERLIGLGYSVLVLDPEGDHVGLGQLRGVIVVGGSGRLPSPEELVQLVAHRFGSIVVDMSTVSDDDRSAYLRAAPAEVEVARERTGLPHWVLLDEAHELLGTSGVARSLLEPGGAGYCLVTHRPELLPPGALLGVDVVISVGGSPPTEAVVNLMAAAGGMSSARAAELLGSARAGQAVLVDRREQDYGVVFSIARRRTAHVRHWHKYALGQLPVERRFHFRSEPGRTTGTTAANLEELERQLRSCVEAVIVHHGVHGDFSRWVTDVLGSPLLGGEMAAVEADLRAGTTSAADARHRLLAVIHRSGDS